MFSRRPAPPAIRDRLLRSLLFISAGAISVAALATFSAVWLLLEADLSARLLSEVGRLALMLERDPSGLRLDLRPAVLESDFSARSRSAFFQIWRPDGSILARSPSLNSFDLPTPPLTADVSDSRDGQDLDISPVTLPTGRSARMAWIRWTPLRGPEPAATSSDAVVVAVALDSQPLRQTLLLAALVILAFSVGVLFLLRWLLRFAVDRGLSGLRVIAAQAAAIDEKNFNRRLNAATYPAEITPVAAALNTLLTRANSALDRERRFSANAAHELRTPLAEIRTLADVAGRVGTPTASAAALTEISLAASQAQTLLNTLLTLARPDASTSEPAREFDAAAALQQQLDRHHEHLQHHQITTEITPGVFSFTAPPAAFATMVSNLVDNAAEYTEPGGSITAQFISEPAHLVLVLRNGPVPVLLRPGPEDLPRLFEPFWRKDPRRADGRHSGLGLALVALLAEHLGGAVSPSLPADNLFEIRVRLPSQPPPRAVDAAPAAPVHPL